MPKLIFSNEKIGYGATIELDNGDVCMISVAQSGVLVRSYRKGFWSSMIGSFFGPVLYRESNVYRATETAMALASSNRPVANLTFQNPVLTAFAQTVWQCSSAVDVAIKLNETL
jgi:hypothetical protein